MRQLSFKDWVFVLQALPVLICSRILVLLLPFKRLAGVLGTLNYVTSHDSSHVSGNYSVKRAGLLLGALSRYLPWRSMCLEQALAGMLLLRCKGYATTIYFGVRQVDKTIKAHAWLRCGDQIVTGALGLESFTVVFTVASAPSNRSEMKPFERPVSHAESPQNHSALAHRQ